MPADKDLLPVLAQNRQWRQSKLAHDPLFFQKLGATHQPKYMWIGCADARVPANEIMGEDAGTVFVARNVANLVVGTDCNLMAAIQYAVDTLKVEHIIVCGHYDCGGIRASVQRKDHSAPLDNWLRNVRDVYRLHRDELNAIHDSEERHRRLVELNVVEQCTNLFKVGAIQLRRQQTDPNNNGVAAGSSGTSAEAATQNEEVGVLRPYATPRIHACVFDPKVGILHTLPVDFDEYMRDFRDIYDLYAPDTSNVAAAATADNSTVHPPPFSEDSVVADP